MCSTEAVHHLYSLRERCKDRLEIVEAALLWDDSSAARTACMTVSFLRWTEPSRQRTPATAAELLPRLQFYAMVDFCNPGVLGTPAQFRKTYEGPILRGREPGATDEEEKAGLTCKEELSTLVNGFILRRTNALLSEHLPPKVGLQNQSTRCICRALFRFVSNGRLMYFSYQFCCSSNYGGLRHQLVQDSTH